MTEDADHPLILVMACDPFKVQEQVHGSALQSAYRKLERESENEHEKS